MTHTVRCHYENKKTGRIVVEVRRNDDTKPRKGWRFVGESGFHFAETRPEREVRPNV